MALLLPNKVWDSQTCSQCQKYLSYGPIKVHTEGSTQIKCGRCNDGEDLHTRSIYNEVAKQLVFPCVNRYEGCTQLLRYEDVPNHEETCIGGQYKCPLCSTKDFKSNSLLYLINHYTIFHKKSILPEPTISLPLNSCFEHSFLYYDNSENFLVVIFVQLDCAKLSVNVSTVGERTGRLKYRFRVIKDGKQEFLSRFGACTSFDNNNDLLAIDFADFIKNALSSLICKLDFDTSQVSNSLCLPYKTALDKNEVPPTDVCLKDYGRGESNFEDSDLKKKFRSIYVPGDGLGTKVIENNGIYYLSVHGKKIHFFCNLCQNYCFLEDQNSLSYCNKCTRYTCRSCIKNCRIVKCGLVAQETWTSVVYIETCIHCKKSYDTSSQCSRSIIFFYCGHGCKNFYKGNELGFHESNCYLNKAQFSNLELAQMTFGKYFRESSEESKTLIYNQNTILIDNTTLKDNGKIYMVTDIFHCLIFYKRHELLYRFQVAHKYLPNKFYIHIQIFQDGAIKEETNNFSVSVKTASFIVILLKVNDEHKRMIEKRKCKIGKMKMDKIRKIILAIIFVLAGMFYFDINKFYELI